MAKEIAEGANITLQGRNLANELRITRSTFVANRVTKGPAAVERAIP
jgi:hypothetical protein